MAITRLQIERAYQLGKQVHAGGIDRQAAIADLHSNHGMDDASAQMYIEALVRMLDGETYKRSINMEATRYYLERIYNDLGSGALEKALISAEGHVDYYDSLGGARKVENRAIVEEFKKLLETPMFTAGSFNTYIKNLETNFFVQAERQVYRVLERKIQKRIDVRDWLRPYCTGISKNIGYFCNRYIIRHIP